MTVTKLLCDLKTFCERQTAHFLYCVPVQKGDTEEKCRPPNVFKQRVPHTDEAEKYSPLILVQYLGGGTKQPQGLRAETIAKIRISFCVYDRISEEEGSIALLTLMDAVKHSLLQQVIIGKQFKLDLETGVEDEVYNENTAPYYIGELNCVFKLPPVEREVYYG